MEDKEEEAETNGIRAAAKDMSASQQKLPEHVDLFVKSNLSCFELNMNKNENELACKSPLNVVTSSLVTNIEIESDAGNCFNNQNSSQLNEEKQESEKDNNSTQATLAASSSSSSGNNIKSR